MLVNPRTASQTVAQDWTNIESTFCVMPLLIMICLCFQSDSARGGDRLLGSVPLPGQSFRSVQGWRERGLQSTIKREVTHEIRRERQSHAGTRGRAQVRREDVHQRAAPEGACGSTRQTAHWAVVQRNAGAYTAGTERRERVTPCGTKTGYPLPRYQPHDGHRTPVVPPQSRRAEAAVRHDGHCRGRLRQRDLSLHDHSKDSTNTENGCCQITRYTVI